MKMNVYGKLTLAMMAGVGVVLCITQFLQYRITSSKITSLIENNLESLQEISQNNITSWQSREEENALNLFLSISHAVAKSLERGEMGKFTELLEKQKSVNGLLEFSLFDRSGLVSHSSDSAYLKKAIPEEAKENLSLEKKRFIRQTEEAIEIYESQAVNADCIRCHMDWKLGEIGGIIHLRYSTQILKEAQEKNISLVKQASQKAQTALAVLQRNILIGGLLTVAAVALVLLALMYLMGQQILVKPLNQIISALRNCMTQIDSASQETLESSQKLALDASDQSASLEETSASLEEMTSMTNQNAQNTNQSQQLVHSTISSIKGVEVSMEKVNSSMNEIALASNETFKIIKTIDQISFQTNLLALNAAVEAARAGAAGASFAVVADEVRSLALQTGEAAKNTAALIADIVNKIKEGNELVQSTSKSFIDVTKQSERVGELIREIAIAGQEQARGLEQVSQATIGLEKVTQENTASAEKNSSTSKELNLQVEEMKKIVQILTQLNGTQ